MRRTLAAACTTLVIFSASPAAAGLGDLAKRVLGGGAILQRGADTCAGTLTLNGSETLALTLAREAAKSALPGAQFVALDATANSDAVSASKAPDFCNKTASRKSSILKTIGDAARKLAGRRLGI
jgi:hypothetical protein